MAQLPTTYYYDIIKSLATVKGCDITHEFRNIFKIYSGYHISISLYFELHGHVF